MLPLFLRGWAFHERLLYIFFGRSGCFCSTPSLQKGKWYYNSQWRSPFAGAFVQCPGRFRMLVLIQYLFPTMIQKGSIAFRSYLVEIVLPILSGPGSRGGYGSFHLKEILFYPGWSQSFERQSLLH